MNTYEVMIENLTVELVEARAELDALRAEVARLNAEPTDDEIAVCLEFADPGSYECARDILRAFLAGRVAP